MSRLTPLILLLALAAGACASRSTGTAAGGPVPRPFPGAPLPPAAPEPAAPVAAPPPPVVAGTPGTPLPIPALVSTALALRGVPYQYGGSDPESGFDCSGFVQYVFARHGLRLPREVRDQYQVGEHIERDEVQPGDLIFFETISRGASHVGLAIGGDQFVHAPSSTGVVRVERFTSSYWGPKFVGARRLARAG